MKDSLTPGLTNEARHTVKRRLNFDVEADGPSGPVSRGTHQRAGISLDRHGR